MNDQTKKPTRRTKLIGGAVIGAILSIGAVSGSASADTSPSPVNVVQQSASSPVKFTGGFTMSSRSGIRW